MIDRQIKLAAFIIVALTCPVAAQSRVTDFRELERTVESELKERDTPGASIAITLGDEVIYARGFGVGSVEDGKEVTPETLFRLGSTTKMMTAAALVTLAARGRLKLDLAIADQVKGLDPRIGSVTPHDLLSNSSGLRDFAPPVESQDDAGLALNVRSWKGDLFFTEPGMIWSYSSPGFWLAGYVVEQAHGKPYADAMEELLFRPLGMNRTTLRPLVALTYPLAIGHQTFEKRTAVTRPAANNTAMWPAGSVYSSARDLARFMLALLNGGRIEGREALPSLVVEKLPAPQFRLPGPDEAYYGYGLMIFRTMGVRVASHGGASRGYGSMIEMVPERRYGLALVTNKSGETLPKSRRRAMELVLGLEPDAPAEISRPLPITPAEMNRSAGRFEHAPQVWEIFIRDGRLMIRNEGREHELTKVGENRFTYGQGNEIILVAGLDGKIEYLFQGLYAARRARP
jgi:CubicO group peptidase (beta-lactamase class C family)